MCASCACPGLERTCLKREQELPDVQRRLQLDASQQRQYLEAQLASAGLDATKRATFNKLLQLSDGELLAAMRKTLNKKQETIVSELQQKRPRLEELRRLLGHATVERCESSYSEPGTVLCHY